MPRVRRAATACKPAAPVIRLVTRPERKEAALCLLHVAVRDTLALAGALGHQRDSSRYQDLRATFEELDAKIHTAHEALWALGVEKVDPITGQWEGYGSLNLLEARLDELKPTPQGPLAKVINLDAYRARRRPAQTA